MDLDSLLIELQEQLKLQSGTAIPTYCRHCFNPFDKKGCPCGRCDWVLLEVLIAETQLAIAERNTKAA